MAVLIFGGMSVVMLIMFVVPVLFSTMQEVKSKF